ncbi:MAG: FG-GAP-like repeat-containing protein, partial [Rhodothermia bacterium]
MLNNRFVLPVLCVLGLLSAPLEVNGQAFTFQFISQDVFPMTLGEAVWGDINRDGRMDLVVTGLAELAVATPIGTTFINLGEIGGVDARGDSVWTQKYLPQGRGVRAAWMSNAAWVDIDHDGVLEFIIAGASSKQRPFAPTTRMYDLSGSEFNEIGTDIIGVFGGSIDWGDYDNDGDPDLLITGESDEGYVTRLYVNAGTPGSVDLVDSGIRMTDMSLGDGQFGDYDGDGDLDILLSGDTGKGFATILYKNEGGTFSEVNNTPFAPLAFSGVDWGDYDNDGDLDILLAGGFLSPLIVEGRARVYRNDGGGTFTDVDAALDGMFYGAAKWGDYDNDGLLDIILSGASDLKNQRLGRLYRNEGGDQFRFSINLAGLLFSDAALGDYDYDGDLDILQIGDGVTVQYRNDQLRVNEPPTIPEGLSTTPANDGVLLSWNPSTDPQTASPGLTYNIRIGTSPSAIDVVAPMADILTGRRYVSGMGNVQNNTLWPIRNLEAGTYFWSVQAVDNAYNSSGWAIEATFTVSASGGIATNTESGEYPDRFELLGSFPNP